MLASLGGALALLLGLAVLLLPLLTPELSRPRDALWGAVVLLLGLVLVTSADRLTGAPMVGVLCGGLLIGRLGLEVAQARWFRLLPEERQQLWSAERWQAAWAQLSQAIAKLLALVSQSLAGLGAWIGERRQPRSSKRWVRPEQAGSETGPKPGAEPSAETFAGTAPEPAAETLAEPAPEPTVETSRESSGEPPAEQQPERHPKREAALKAQLGAPPETPLGTRQEASQEAAAETETTPAAALETPSAEAPDTPPAAAPKTAPETAQEAMPEPAPPAAPETTAPNTQPAAPEAESIAAPEPAPTTWISSLAELDQLLDQAEQTPAIAGATNSAPAGSDDATELVEPAMASANAAANLPEHPAASDRAG
jgi:hypothetical protein